VSGPEESRRVLYLPDGLRFQSGPDTWSLSPLAVEQGEWLAIAPEGPEPVVDPAVPLSRIIATMLEPEIGEVELFQENIYRVDYGIRQRLRARMGFVHGYGGLLSNRTINAFGLTGVADMSPHEVDGSTRWNVCLARAMVLGPEWLVLEGIGTWEMDRGRGTSWRCLMEQRHTSKMACAICLPRQNPGFEAWFEALSGQVVRYRRVDASENRR
jgi:hypothetical protein